MSRRPRAAAAAAACLAVLTAAGCASGGAGTGDEPFGVYPAPSGPYTANEALIEGTLDLVDGCLVVVTEDWSVPLLLPSTMRWEDGALVSDGEVLELGEQVRFGGGERSRELGHEHGMPESCPGTSVWQVQ